MRTWLLLSKCEGADDGRMAVRSITCLSCVAGALPVEPGQTSLSRIWSYALSLARSEGPS